MATLFDITLLPCQFNGGGVIVVLCFVHLLYKMFVLDFSSSAVCWMDLDFGNCHFI